ncbi:MAG: AEC family transporter [Clostridia bacterium]|nr:AEC family transporter [Clostridia bacterium]
MVPAFRPEACACEVLAMSSPFETMVALQLQLFLFVLAGFVLTRLHTITPEGRKSLSDLLINFILPCNIICSFQLDMNAQVLTSCGLMLLIACAAQVFYLLVSRLIYPGAPKERLACLRYGTVCSNAGFLGLPIIGGVYGAMGTLLTSVALIPQRVVMWSAGLSLFTHTDGKSVVRKLLTHPCIVAVFIGFALMLAGNPALPSFLQKSLSAVSGCTTCMSMLVIGSILAGAEHIDFGDRMMWWYAFVRLILIPLLVLALLSLLPIDGTVRGVMVLISAMPAGSTTAILAARYEGDAPFASCLVFVTTLLSLVTLPLLCLLL